MVRRAAKLQRIGDILSRALKKRHVPFQPGDRRLIDAWEAAVGQQIAAQSRPERIRRDTLVVTVRNSIWMQQLHFLKTELISKVNASPAGFSIKDIRFSIGQFPLSPGKGNEKTTPPPAGQLKQRDKKMVESCLALLKDDDLKEIIKRVMVKEITFRRGREKKVP